MTASAINDMTTSALKVYDEATDLQIITEFTSLSSFDCGTITYTISGNGTPLTQPSNNELQILSTTLSDVTTDPVVVTVTGCYDAYSDVCATTTFSYTVTACEVT